MKKITPFSPCPDSPNCVSSKEKPESSHYIAPLPLKGNADKGMEVMLKVIQSFERVDIVTQTPVYVHATFKSWLFRFVDDVEIEISEKEKVIHFKSASRTGYYDMGVNRKRIMEIKKKYLTDSSHPDS